MYQYRILDEETKGDFAFEVYADSPEELFEGAALATMSAMVDLSSLNISEKWFFNIHTKTLSELLYDFLSEIVFVKDTEGLLFKKFDVRIFEQNDGYMLECTALGEHINPESQILYTDVKAVTYYHFTVEQRDDKWYCYALLDL